MFLLSMVGIGFFTVYMEVNVPVCNGSSGGEKGRMGWQRNLLT